MIKNTIISCLLLLVGALAGYSLRSMNEKSTDANLFVGQQIRLGSHSLINPLLECEISDGTVNIVNQELIPFKKQIQEYIDKQTSENKASEISVYFRDLNNGPWIGIREKEYFAPASLLKVPIMITYLKESEKNPEILNEKIEFLKEDGDRNEKQSIKPQIALEEEKEYSVDELLERMIVYSDNNALALLAKHIGKEKIDQVFTDLGVTIANARSPEDYMSVRQYATFFRVLYNASYLSYDMSNKALDLLRKTQFKGMAELLPDSITVAHKFGELDHPGGLKQLHDCGIVYYPKRTYLLCIMTRGNNADRLNTTIKEISKVVYTEVDKQFNEN